MYQIYCASVFWLKQKSLGVLGQNFNTVLVSVQPIIIANYMEQLSNQFSKYM